MGVTTSMKAECPSNVLMVSWRRLGSWLGGGSTYAQSASVRLTRLLSPGAVAVWCG